MQPLLLADASRGYPELGRALLVTFFSESFHELMLSAFFLGSLTPIYFSLRA